MKARRVTKHKKRNGLKDRQIAALINKINDELDGRYAEHYKLPQGTRMTVKLAVEDYLSENQLRLDKLKADVGCR